ncbi:hypothetical protein ND748_05735, partial [Frankia sp. AiPs1]|nr:hypothetical protein [Frankia sp. AiPs1]
PATVALADSSPPPISRSGQLVPAPAVTYAPLPAAVAEPPIPTRAPQLAPRQAAAVPSPTPAVVSDQPPGTMPSPAGGVAR